MPTIKVSDVIYKRLVKLAGSLQSDFERMVTVDEALEHLFKTLDEWHVNTKKIEKEMNEIKEAHS